MHPVSANPRGNPSQQMLLGIDTAGSAWLGKPGAPPCSVPNALDAIHDLGANYVVYHYTPITGQGPGTSGVNAEKLQEIDKCMRTNRLRYTLNNEVANWKLDAEINPGNNEFAHPDGTHRWDFRMDWLNALLPPAKPGIPALLGITYDEAEHMQLTLNQFVGTSDGKPYQAPYLLDTEGMSLEKAYKRLVGRCATIRKEYYQGRIQTVTEQVWPDMFHIFARAGWTITPKLLKENLSSIVMSVALGAALEYESHGTSLWVSPDLWRRDSYPGHSPEALRSSLLMGYWLGAEALYVENFDWMGSANKQGSLILWTNDGEYELTPYGKVVREFYKSYIPDNPRTINWKDYRPRVAIIRLPDGAWGQRGTIFRDALLGNTKHPMDDASSEWLDLWPTLTHGTAKSGAISLNNTEVYPDGHVNFFVPIDSVAVFDHEVTGRVLDSVECFVICGSVVSRATFRDVAHQVARGATCIIPRRLYSRHASGNLPGHWVIVDSIRDKSVAEALQPFLGPSDVARFRFKDSVVEFRARQDKDKISVKTTSSTKIKRSAVLSQETAMAIDKVIDARRPRVMLNPSNQYGNQIHGEGGVELYNEGRNMWLIAEAIKRNLDADGRVETFLSRSSQSEETTLGQEARLTNELGCDLLIALHSDATGNNTPGAGTWTFYTGQKNLRPGELYGLTYDLGDSLRIAELVQSNTVDAIRKIYPEEIDRGVLEHWYRLYMIHQPKCPSCLIEVLFHTNPKERELLKDPAFQELVGKAISRAVLEYFN